MTIKRLLIHFDNENKLTIKEGIDYVDFLRHHYVIIIDNDNNWN